MMASLIIKPMHECEPFQQAEHEGIIDSTQRFTDNTENYKPYCLFSYKADGGIKDHYPIDFCPFCGQNLNVPSAPQD
jgi:hypothetical protein